MIFPSLPSYWLEMSELRVVAFRVFLAMHYGYPEASQVACLWQSIRFTSQTEKRKLALSRGRAAWIQAPRGGLGWEAREQRREKDLCKMQLYGQEKGLKKKTRKVKIVIVCSLQGKDRGFRENWVRRISLSSKILSCTTAQNNLVS